MVEVKPQMDTRSKWPAGHQYEQPCKCRTIKIGNKRQHYIQPERPHSFAPQKVYKAPDVKMPDGTTYKMSYESFDPKVLRSCRGLQKLTKSNLASAGKFYDDTTHKMSYEAWPGMTRQPMTYPRDHRLVGEGPMQNETTHRHDFTPKEIDMSEKCIQPGNIGLSEAPMDGNSTMSMSYRCPDYERFEPSQSYRPQKRYIPPDDPLEGKTIQKLSYMPWAPQKKPDMPWAEKSPYTPPQVPLDGKTIYKGSYIPPGIMIDNDPGPCPGCYCKYPGECLDKSDKPPDTETCPPDYNPQTDPPRSPPITEEKQ